MRTAGRIACLLALGGGLAAAAQPVAPYGPVPSSAQLAWHEVEYYGMICLSTITWADKEWGWGNEPAASFDPAEFDARTIAETMREAGMRGLLLVAKHHGGFCLWPTATSDYSVRSSPWRNGQGDMVRAFAEASREAGLRFGIYISPWDRHHADYARPAYVEAFHRQWEELLTGYGPLFLAWFDGANGGDGWYGGANDRRSIAGDYYRFPRLFARIREAQPQAVIFGDARIGGDIRWVGNERGLAGDPCWSTFGEKTGGGDINRGVRGGSLWLPAECDVPLRPGWFYHGAEDGRVKSPAQLMDLYFASVGRGQALDLGLAPDRRGRLHDNDIAALRGFGQRLRSTFATNLAAGARAEGPARGGDARHAPAALLDGNPATYWATDDGVTDAEVVLHLPAPRTFNVVEAREFIALGQRADGFSVDAWQAGAWRPWAEASAIGPHRYVRGPDCTTDRVRFRVRGPVCPAVSAFGLYFEPDRPAGTPLAAVPRQDKSAWRVVAVSDEPGPARHAIDGDPRTLWHTHGPDGEHPPPHELVIDLGASRMLAGVTMLPRSDGTLKGTPDRYEVRLSDDPQAWSEAPLAAGEFGNLRANPVEQTVRLPDSRRARYVKFTAVRALDGVPCIAVAEIGVIEK